MLTQLAPITVSRPTGLVPVLGGTPPKGGTTGRTAFVAGLLSFLGRVPSLNQMDEILSPVGASGAGASMATAPEQPSSKRFYDSLHFFAVIEGLMPSYEVFAPRTFSDVVAEVKRRVTYKFWNARGSHGLLLEDAISVATLSLLEYWIPRFASEDTDKNYRFALTYGVHRAADHLLNEIDYSYGKVSLDDDSDDTHPLGEMLRDPSPTPEELFCSDAVVADVRRLVDELDWETCLSEETTRQEAKRTGRSQSTVTRNRSRARNCVRAAYVASI